ncbi:MAG: hypothetical protein RLZZ455_1003 [Candidatus Parcubacteria bacterium]|jgi:hypothetical protein
MDTPAKKDEQFLPREPLDLPRPEKELPAHTETHTRPDDVQTLLSWHAPGRPFRKRNKEYFINILLIMLAVEVILFLFAQYFLMLVVLALVFVNYALKTVAPHDFRYKVSTEGVMVEDYFFLWQELYDFYFKQFDGVESLVIRTKTMVPGELTVILGDMSKEHVKAVLLPYLPYREYIKPTFMEKSGDWLSRTFPLEKSPHKAAS